MKDVANDDTLRGAVARFDPEISEWGNPIVVMHNYPVLNT